MTMVWMTVMLPLLCRLSYVFLSAQVWSLICAVSCYVAVARIIILSYYSYYYYYSYYSYFYFYYYSIYYYYSSSTPVTPPPPVRWTAWAPRTAWWTTPWWTWSKAWAPPTPATPPPSFPTTPSLPTEVRLRRPRRSSFIGKDLLLQNCGAFFLFKVSLNK